MSFTISLHPPVNPHTVKIEGNSLTHMVILICLDVTKYNVSNGQRHPWKQSSEKLCNLWGPLPL